MRLRRPTAWMTLIAALGVILTGAAAGPRVYPEPALITPPGYRSTADLSSLDIGAREWLGQGQVPGAGTPWSDMATWALVDLYSYLRPNGSVAAGPGSAWTYTWPRDASFVAVALSRTGHPGDAERVLEFLAALPYDRTVGFDARYTLTGQRVTGTRARPPQSDGCGWVLWAIGTVRAGRDPRQDGRSVDALVDRCTRTLLEMTHSGRAIPAGTPDYIELPVAGTTLASVAPMVAGLRGATRDLARRGDSARAAQAALAADALRRTLTQEFGPHFERYGAGGGADAGTAMLLPPFGDGGAMETRAWLRYQREAKTPSGGLAPAVDWRPDGTAWTPETALVAYTAAASGDRGLARHWLTWLDAHRTAYGSLPERVTRSGRPAGPAPLLWTSALVLLTLTELDRG